MHKFWAKHSGNISEQRTKFPKRSQCPSNTSFWERNADAFWWKNVRVWYRKRPRPTWNQRKSKKFKFDVLRLLFYIFEIKLNIVLVMRAGIFRYCSNRVYHIITTYKMHLKFHITRHTNSGSSFSYFSPFGKSKQVRRLVLRPLNFVSTNVKWTDVATCLLLYVCVFEYHCTTPNTSELHEH